MEQYPASLSSRYEARRAEIGEIFFDGRNPGAIVSASGVGDRRQRGESVLRVETETGDMLYYKLRDGAATDFDGFRRWRVPSRRVVPAPA